MAVNRCMVGLLLLLANSAQANEADNTIRRLVGEAQAYAVARSPAGLSRTLFEIAKVLPNASDDGIAAVNELSRYLADAANVTPGQDAAPAAGPTPAAPLPPPIESQPAEPSEPPARESGAEAQQSPPAPAPAAPALPAPALPALALPAPAPPAPASPAPASPVSASPVPAPPAPAPSAPALPATAVAPQASLALLDLLRRQGTAALGNGDISGARRFFQRGAEAGCASCAEGMAQTFDAEQLNRIGAIGIRSDPAQAEAWRARARQLTQTRKP